MPKPLRKPALWGATAALGAAALSCSSLLSQRGLPNTADGALHLVRAVEYAWCLSTGTLVPRWAPHLAFGFGFPLFRYVPPLLLFLVDALSSVGLPAQEALKAGAVLACALGALGCYLAALDCLGPGPAAVAAAAFALAPFRFFELYIQGNYPQLLALSLLPWGLAGANWLAQGRARRGALTLGLTVALVVLSHNLTALVGLPLLLAYAAVRVLPAGKKAAVTAAASTLGGLLLGAFFWLPAFVQLGEAQLANATRGYFRYELHFLSFAELVALPARLDQRCLNPYFPRGLGGHMVMLALPSVFLLGRREAPRRQVLFFWAACLLCAFMSLPASRPLWAALPLLHYVQFPWRFANLTTLPLALLVGYGASAWWRGRLGTAWGILCLGALLWGAAPYALPARPLVDLSGLTAQAIPAWEEKTGAVGTTASGEYLPAAARIPSPQDWARFGHARLLSLSAHTLSFAVRASSPGSIALPVLFFPGWRAQSEDEALTLGVEPGTGFLQVQLPAGEHVVTLHFGPTGVDLAGFVLSLAGASLLVATVWRSSNNAQRPAQPAQPQALPLAALALAALILRHGLPQGLLQSIFALYSPPGKALPAQHELSARFGSELVLLGYSLQRNLPPRGEPLLVELYWQPLGELRQDYELILELASLTDGRTFLRSARADVAGLGTSSWHPALYVADRRRLLLPADLPAAVYALRVAVRDPATGQYLRLETGEELLTLQSIHVLYHQPLDIRPFPRQERFLFGGEVQLIGYQLHTPSARPGGTIRATLYWRAERQVGTAWKRFAHLVEEGGEIVAQEDCWPVMGLYPTNLWLPQHNIADDVTIVIPPQARPGTMRLVVGLYDPTTMQRPPVLGTRSGQLESSAVLLPEAVRILAP